MIPFLHSLITRFQRLIKLDVLLRHLGRTLPLFCRSNENFHMPNTQEVYNGEDYDYVRIDVLGLPEAVLMIQRGAKHGADEFSDSRAGHKNARDVVVELFQVVISVVSLLDRLEHLRQDGNRNHPGSRADNHQTDHDHDRAIF